MLLAGVLGFGLLYLRTDRFQEFARKIIISKLEKATGLECRIRSVRLDVFRGRISMTGLALVPRVPAPGLATLKVDEIRSTISISSFWHFRARLADLNIVRPHVEFLPAGGEARWNPEEVLKAVRMSLRLEAANVVVRDGWVIMNNRVTSFHLSLEDLDCEIHYAAKLPSYKISVSYKRSRIFWEGRDIRYDLEAIAELSLQGIDIEYFKLVRGGSLFTGSGSFKNWNSPVLLIKAAGILDARDLMLAHPSINEGRGNIGVLANLRYDRNGIYSNGRFTARSGSYRKMNYSSLAGNFEINRDVLYFRNSSGRAAKGSFLVNGDIQLRDANKAINRVTIVTKEVPIIDAGRFLKLPLLDIENPADSTNVLTWFGGQPVKAECDVYIHGLADAGAESGKRMLLEGPVKFTYVEGADLQISSASLKSPTTAVEASGGQDSLFHVQMSTSHIPEPFKLIAGFSPPIADMLARQPDLLKMTGTYDFDGDVRIKSSSDVEYGGTIAVRNGRWRTYKVESLTTRAFFSSPHLVLHSVKISSGAQKVEGDLDLEFAEKEEIRDLKFEGDARQISLTTLKSFGADTEKIEGIANGSGTIELKNGVWGGKGQLSIEKGNYDGESFDLLEAQLRLENQRLHLIRAEARRGNARLSVEGQYNLESRQLKMTTRIVGLRLEEIPAVREKQLPIQGRVSASGSLTGTSQHPIFDGEFNFDSLHYGRWNLGHAEGQIGLQNEVFHGNARILSEFGSVAVQADISTAAGYPGKALLEFSDLDIQKIVPGKAPQYLEEISTALKGKVEIEGKFDDSNALKLRGEVDGAHFKVQDYELHNAGRIQFTVQNRELRLGSVRFVGEGTNLALSGTIPLDNELPLDVTLNGDLNMRLLEGIEGQLHTGGSAALNIHAGGSGQNPQIIGRASIKDALLDHPDFPLRLSAMQGDIVFSRNLVRLENVRGAAASGTIQLSGVIEHQNAVLRSINLGISIRNARLPYPKDFRSVFNAELVLSGAGDVKILGGEVDVIRMEYIRNFNLLEQLASHNAVQSGPLTTEPYLLGLRLNVEIHSDNGLYIDNELTNLRGGLRLTLRGTPAYPSLTGRVEVSEGTIFFRGSRFQISHAAANFTDRNRINPVLEIRAEADVKTYRLILDVIGDLDHLNMNVTSDPPMSTVDILSLLTTGKTDTGTITSQRESEMAGVSAASVLSENLTGVLGKRVQRIFGLESFRVDPFLAGAENDPTARLTISERLSKDLVVTFSRNLTTNREQIVVIEYDVGKNLSVVATRDENGKYGLDFRFRKRLR